MRSLLWMIFGSSLIHVVEEYRWPGGFMPWLAQTFPKWATSVTSNWAVSVNAAMFALLLVAIVTGDQVGVLGLSVAALILINAAAHIGGTFVTHRYSPGAVSATVLYVPIGLTTWVLATKSGQVSVATATAGGLLGVMYQAVPLASLAVLTHRSTKPKAPSSSTR